MIVVDARVVDATHLELTQPINVPRGRKVTVSLAQPEPEHDEHAEWAALGANTLSAAYGDSEPEYTLDLIVDANPEFQP